MTDTDAREPTGIPTATTMSNASSTDHALPRATLIALSFSTFATVTVEMLPSGLLPQIGRGLGVEPAVVGGLVTAWALTIAVTSMPLVRVTRNVRRTRLLPAALAVVAAAVLATSLAPTFEIALAGRIVSAAAHGVFWAVIVVYVSEIVAPDRIGRALAIVLAGPAVAGLVGLPIGAALVDVVGWRGVFGGASAILAVTAIALTLILTDPGRTTGSEGSFGADERTSGSGWDRSAIASTGTALAGTLVLLGHFVVFTYISMIVTDAARFGSGSLAILLAVFGAAGAVGVTASGWLSDRWPRATVPATVLVLLTAFVIVTVAPTVPVLFVIAIVLWGLVSGVFPPAMQVRVLRLASARFRTTARGVVVATFDLGVAAGAAFGGAVVGSGVDRLAPVALVVTTVGAVALVLLARVGTAPVPSP
ncbi:MFS transporter [Rhodococcus rhodochrous]|uniref:MFS transporter n=1 Tax=Rhodococcus rhodochrous TaxID=1829 RepID=A0AAW4XEB5_RHORH|nr:MFS transporter [Rhodococcus rhodochrous]MCD2111174.1 MFS transporter [Rhodococcus rhodochrous]